MRMWAAKRHILPALVVYVGGEMIPFAGFGGFLGEVDVDGKKVSFTSFSG